LWSPDLGLMIVGMRASPRIRKVKGLGSHLTSRVSAPSGINPQLDTARILGPRNLRGHTLPFSF